MTESTPVSESRLRDSPTQIQAVRQALGEGLEGAPPGPLLDFAGIFLGRAPEAFLRSRKTPELAAATREAYRFLESRGSEQVSVSVTNPEVSREAGAPRVTVVQSYVTKRPFIVDTIREFLHQQGLVIGHMIYPLLDVERDAENRVVAVRPASDTGARESLVYCEIEQVRDPAKLEYLTDELTRRLHDVVRATDDFKAMLEVLGSVGRELEGRAATDPASAEELAEIQEFLHWLRDGAFVFLGYRAYQLVTEEGTEPAVLVQPGSGLGVLRNEAQSRFAAPVPFSQLPANMRALAEHGPTLLISKSNAESTVHRAARMDYIGIKKVDERRRAIGEHRFLGLFTSRAYAEPADNVPILRKKLARVLEGARVRKGSHDYKAIITIFESLPREGLFVSPSEQIAADVRTVLTSYGTDEVLVTLRDDPLSRGRSVMVILPRDRFSGDGRKQIEAALLEAFGGEVLNYHLTLGEGDQARLHFHLSTTEEQRRVDPVALEHTIRRLIRTWGELLEEELERRLPPEAAAALARRYGNAFDPEYRAGISAATAATDVLALEAMFADGRGTSVSLVNRGEEVSVAGVTGVTELKVTLVGERLVLSDFMPFLEDLGLTVIAMNPFKVSLDAEAEATIYVFAVQDGERRPLDVEARGALIAETVLAARAGDAVSDSLNALVLTAGLHWREVDVLRGLAGYTFQKGAVPSRLALPAALVNHPGIAKELFDLFRAKFDPSTGATREERLAAAADIRTAFRASLESVSLLAADRALRRLEEVITSAVRTNFYRRGGCTPTLRSGGVPFVSFKFLLSELERSRPMELLYEVWVHSSRMEGVHLRGSQVARGGIRWSDRPDDFRKEILGLVKTQMVKNAVIVPGGSKGGFVTRRIPVDPQARLAEGKEQYRTLMRGLLDLTDNLVNGVHAPPEGVVCFDAPDPYLVVAADKGTAAFSDLANEVADEYGFWLGDAFASGGSFGYDHKAIGITARGGWECVRRHFFEMGKDIQAEPFTVVGIGDMSGDVFGNGMLLSPHIRLVAAFDHRHVFIDPDPDPVTAFAERQRLFGLLGSSWGSYDRSALSRGGMIVPRGAKQIDLTPEAKRALGVAPEDRGDPLDGEALIRHVLRAPVELLWNGGIGTYVKATAESHAEASDPTNDAVRVDAQELRCQVVGEGGNLGFTQRARVEYALLGGRINTDALDNSGGVDMSDHEVNLKILLAPAVAARGMTSATRNQLLGDLTGTVAELVLRDNYSQSLAVSLDEQRAKESPGDFRDLMFAMEKVGDIDRGGEGLPSRDVLAERAEVRQSLVRPELCVLLAHAKLSLKDTLLRGTLPDDPVAESYLVGYFPPTAALAAGSENLATHRLRREIIASQLTNDLVDLMGSTFVHRLTRDGGTSPEQVAMAWLVASRLADHRALLNQLGDQHGVADARTTSRWLLGLARVLERTTRWVLLNVDSETAPAAAVSARVEGLATLREAFADCVTGEERAVFESRVAEIRSLGGDEAFSKRLITLRFLDQLLEILETARRAEADPVSTAFAFYESSDLLHVPWLRRRIFEAGRGGQWEKRAAQLLSEDLSRAHRKVVVEVLGADGASERQLRALDVQRFRALVEELKKEEGGVGLAALSVATRGLSRLADRAARQPTTERRR